MCNSKRLNKLEQVVSEGPGYGLDGPAGEPVICGGGQVVLPPQPDWCVVVPGDGPDEQIILVWKSGRLVKTEMVRGVIV